MLVRFFHHKDILYFLDPGSGQQNIFWGKIIHCNFFFKEQFYIEKNSSCFLRISHQVELLGHCDTAVLPCVLFPPSTVTKTEPPQWPLQVWSDALSALAVRKVAQAAGPRLPLKTTPRRRPPVALSS